MSLNLNYQAEVVVETEDLSREEWLRYRRQGIGGSDVAAIMGFSPFCTKRDLYYDKLGIKPAMDEEESNWVAKEVGHRLEDLVAEIFSKKTGLTVFPIRKMFRHPLYPFMLADADFFIKFPDGSLGILECKTTNYNCQDKWENDSVPINYEYQGRHYMSVMNINKMYFACLYGNNENEFIIRYMERDLELEERMKESYMEIVEELGTSCSGILKDGNIEYFVTYNPAYRTGIDKKSLEKLKIHYPDIYDDYVSTTESRRFTVKMKGAA